MSVNEKKIAEKFVGFEATVNLLVQQYNEIKKELNNTAHISRKKLQDQAILQQIRINKERVRLRRSRKLQNQQ